MGFQLKHYRVPEVGGKFSFAARCIGRDKKHLFTLREERKGGIDVAHIAYLCFSAVRSRIHPYIPAVVELSVGHMECISTGKINSIQRCAYPAYGVDSAALYLAMLYASAGCDGAVGAFKPPLGIASRARTATEIINRDFGFKWLVGAIDSF